MPARTPRRSRRASPSRRRSIWATMPPTRPATIGRAFQSASVTVSPKPSFVDFWISACRVHLERVHLDRADVVHVAEDVDVRVAVCVLDRAVVVVPAFRIVVRHRADQRELHLRETLLDQAVRVDHAERVLPRIEARDLREQRTLDVDAELVDDVCGVLRRERHVLRHQRVDRRRPDHDRQQAGRRAARTRACGRSPRRNWRIDGSSTSKICSVRRREVDVAAPDPLRAPVGKRVDHRNRLRVVDDHEVVVVLRELAPRSRALYRAKIACSSSVSEPRVALQSVVDRLRHVEELVCRRG